jgi:rhomboid protease GluP
VTDETDARSSQVDETTRGPLVTWVVCAACIVVYLVLITQAGREETPLPPWAYASADEVWDGNYWATLTTVFVHTEIWHLALNVYWLWVLGGATEKAIGPLKYLALICFAGFVSSAIQLGASGDTGIGASGVVYAIFGFMWVSRRHYQDFAQAVPVQTAALFAVWLLVCIVVTRAGLYPIGNAAHVSGLLCGAGIGLAAAHKKAAAWIVTAEAMLAIAAGVSLCWCPWTWQWVGKQAKEAHKAGNFGVAIEHYQRSLALGADPVWIWQNIALANASQGKEAAYAEALETVRRLNPNAADEVEKVLAAAHP